MAACCTQVEGVAPTHVSPLKSPYLVVLRFFFFKCVCKQGGDLGGVDGIGGHKTNGVHFGGVLALQTLSHVHRQECGSGKGARRAGREKDPAAPSLLLLSLLPSVAIYPSLNGVCLPDLPRMKCHILD